MTLPRSKACPKFTDAVKMQREKWLDQQAQTALDKNISLSERLQELERPTQIPQEKAGPLGIDWSIT